MPTQISKHFTLEEFLASNTATAKGITANFNPVQRVIDNGTALCQNVLDAVRDLVEVPVMLSSGYRCPELNTLEHGMPDSQHLCLGGSAAADIYAQGYTPDSLYEKIKASAIVFDELIIEHDGAGNRWVHISYDTEKGEQRGICFKGVLTNGGTICVADGYGAWKNAA